MFCGSKKNVETLAESLSLKMRVPVNFTSDELGAIGRLQDSKLRALARLGFGFHHAGLPPEDKETVEELYLHRKLLVLTCTRYALLMTYAMCKRCVAPSHTE